MKSPKSAAVAGTLIVRGVEYVVIPKAEYLVLRDGAAPADGQDAHAFVRESIGRDLRAAREHAGLTQAGLAAKLGKSQTMVSQAESGMARVSERYVRAVLKACRLPEDWTGPKPKRPRKSAVPGRYPRPSASAGGNRPKARTA